MTRRTRPAVVAVLGVVVAASLGWPSGPMFAQRAGQAAPSDGQPGPVVSPPRLISKVDPAYTEMARRAAIAGEVWLDVVVGVDGTVGQVQVARSLDQTFGLDDAAIAAARQWRFEPARQKGAPVPVSVTLILEFTLQPEVRRVFPPPSEAEADFVKDAVWGAVTMGLSQPSPVGACSAPTPAGAQGVRADITVQAVVDIDGRVVRVRPASSSDPGSGLVNAALQAALRCRFRPGVLLERAVPVIVSMEFHFR